MGRSTTPIFRLEIETDNGRFSTMAWNVKTNYGTGYGPPTETNLRKWVSAFEQSTQPGGCNAHVGPTRVLWAQIVRQRGNETVIELEFPSEQPEPCQTT